MLGSKRSTNASAHAAAIRVQSMSTCTRRLAITELASRDLMPSGRAARGGPSVYGGHQKSGQDAGVTADPLGRGSRSLLHHDVVRILQPAQTPLAQQTLVHRSQPALECRVDRRAERDRLAVHG